MNRIFIFITLQLIILINAFGANKNYIGNRLPLIETPYLQLPIGSVKATGWLLNQLQLQKDGLTGNSEILYNSANDLGSNSDWLGGTGNSWERAPYYVKGLISLAYTLHDEELITKATKWINWSLNSQRTDGLFGPTSINDWWARMPMLYAIRDYYEETNDARVIPFFTKYFQYQNDNIESNRLSGWAQARAGDNIEIVFWLYNRTGDTFLLSLADKLKSQAYDWTDIFTNNKFNHFHEQYFPKHNVNVPQAMKMPAIYSQKSNLTADKEAYVLGREHLMHDHGQPQGMQSGNEKLSGKSAITGLELCSIVEQMQSCETAQMILGDPTIGDQLEKVAFNALPGSLSKDHKGLQYYTQANQVKSKLGDIGFEQGYENGLLPGPYSGFPCCRFNLHMGWPYYVKTMWAATNDNGLAAMAYGPSQVTANVSNGVQVTITENTNYPFDEQLNFKISAPQAVAFPLKLRIPAWCSNPEVEVNGVAQKEITTGSFCTIDRTWNNNDEVILRFPMTLKVNDEVNNAVSIERGPLVYSLKMSENWVARNDYGNGFKEYDVLPLTNWNYALNLDKNNPAASIQINKGTMPVNPFLQSTTPVTLTVSGKRLTSWGYAIDGLTAIDPPFGPVQTNTPIEQLTFVPFGSENLRVTCFPLVGTSNLISSTSFQDDFTDGDQVGWVNYSGSFFVQNGEYVSTNVERPGSKSVQTSTLFSDFTYDAKVKLEGTDGNAGLLFRASKFSMGADDYNGYYVGIGAGDKQLVFGKANGTWTSLKSVNMNVEVNKWYQFRVVAKGTNIKIFVDDMIIPKIEYTDASFLSGSIGVRGYNSLARWDDISINNASTGVGSLTTTQDIKVYPNPTKNYINISFANNLTDNYKIDLVELSGSLINSINRSKEIGCVQLKTENLNSGIYLLNISSATQSYQYKVVNE